MWQIHINFSGIVMHATRKIAIRRGMRKYLPSDELARLTSNNYQLLTSDRATDNELSDWAKEKKLAF